MSMYADIIKKCKKDWACPDLLESVNKVSREKIPFSSPSLNYITYGGIPKVGFTHFFGFEGSGKSTTAMDVCKNAYIVFAKDYEREVAELEEKVASGEKEYKIPLADLKERGPKKVLYIDIEHTYDRKWAATLGLSEMLDVMQPPNIAAEKILNAIYDLVDSGEMGLIVLDSVPSLVPETELKKKIGERTVAALANLMTQTARRLNPILFRGQCALILINQQRENMDNPYKEKVPGGTALRFYASLELMFSRGNPVDFLGNEIPLKSDSPAGYKIVVTVKKQKTAPFDRRRGEYYLMAKSGLRVDFEFVQLAVNQYDIIHKHGGWYYIRNPKTMEQLEIDGKDVKVNGMPNVYDYVQINQDYYQELCDAIIEKINSDGLTITSEVEEDTDE